MLGPVLDIRERTLDKAVVPVQQARCSDIINNSPNNHIILSCSKYYEGTSFVREGRKTKKRLMASLPLVLPLLPSL